MKKLITAFGLLAAIVLFSGKLAFASNQTGTADQSGPILVELFTSQGCYSCPPADDVLGDLAKRDDILALGFHVTYWDRLGWTDTLGLESSTERQYWYRGRIQSRGVYTPQMVIGGHFDVVGSRSSAVHDAVVSAGQSLAPLPVTITREDKSFRVELPGSIDLNGTQLVLAAFDLGHTVDIPRGENGGKVLDYHHVVRDLVTLNMQVIGDRSFQITTDVLDFDEKQGIAAFIQDRANARILASGQHRPWHTLSQ